MILVLTSAGTFSTHPWQFKPSDGSAKPVWSYIGEQHQPQQDHPIVDLDTEATHQPAAVVFGTPAEAESGAC